MKRATDVAIYGWKRILHKLHNDRTKTGANHPRASSDLHVGADDTRLDDVRLRQETAARHLQENGH
eukprot:5620168-Pleurochrysis_carterae.AAC.1